MQLGINLLCAAGRIDHSHYSLFDLAKEHGYDGVEIPILGGSPLEYDKLGTALSERGLGRTCTAITPDPNADPTHSDPDIRARGIAHHNWIIECADALSADVIGGPFHAPIGHFTGTGPTTDEWKRGADAHHNMADRAANSGIKLALEPLNRFETHYLNTAAQAAQYCDLVDHPNFTIMYDTFHSHIEEKDQAKAIQTLAGHIGVLHVSENDRGIPGTGQIDFDTIFASVKAADFDGWVVVEAFGAGLPDLAAATRIWRPMFDTHTELFAQSAKFVRTHWDAAL